MASPTSPAKMGFHLAVIVGLFALSLYTAWRLWNGVSHAAAVFPIALCIMVLTFYSGTLWLTKR